MWVWMKGVDKALVDKAIDPVSPEDDRPNVLELIQKHAETIEKVRVELRADPLYDKSKHDDLWILRFVLSHKSKVKSCVQASKTTLLYRKRYNLDEIDLRHYDVPFFEAKDMALGGVPSIAHSVKVRLSKESAAVSIPNQQLGVLAFLRFSEVMKSNVELSKKLSDEDWNAPFVVLSEWCFQWLDYVTRTTGRLTKNIRFLSMKDATLLTALGNRTACLRDGKIMAEMEDCYPQLLHALYIHDAPHWMHVIWSIMRRVMPKRVVEKIAVLEPKKNPDELKMLLGFVDIETLPESLGGKNKLSPSDWPAVG